MVNTGWGSLLIVCGLYALTRYVVIPYVRLSMKRHEAMTHIPTREEIWVQNDQLLYIDEVNASGVELLAYDSRTNQAYRWSETWDQWQHRLNSHTLFYTGQKRPLGPVV